MKYELKVYNKKYSGSKFFEISEEDFCKDPDRYAETRMRASSAGRKNSDGHITNEAFLAYKNSLNCPYHLFEMNSRDGEIWVEWNRLPDDEFSE